jgi:hypothetical protein
MMSILWLLLVASSPTAGPPLDFVYFEHLPELAEVTFALHGSCPVGVPALPQVGVIIEKVEANGQNVEPYRPSAIYPEDVKELNIIPSPSFFYHLNVGKLKTYTPDFRSAVAFPLKGLPKKLAVTYRIRCADGTTSGVFVTRGQRFARYPGPLTIMEAKDPPAASGKGQ